MNSIVIARSSDDVKSRGDHVALRDEAISEIQRLPRAISLCARNDKVPL